MLVFYVKHPTPNTKCFSRFSTGPSPPDDPGEYMESETVAGTVATYNVGNAADAGWHYGFVALKKDGTRVYSDRNTEPTGVASFTLPANTEKLYFIVLGAPKQYKPHPWNDEEKER